MTVRDSNSAELPAENGFSRNLLRVAVQGGTVVRPDYWIVHLQCRSVVEVHHRVRWGTSHTGLTERGASNGTNHVSKTGLDAEADKVTGGGGHDLQVVKPTFGERHDDDVGINDTICSRSDR